MSRLRADVDKSNAARPIFGQYRCISRRDAFENRFLDSQVRFMNRGNKSLMLAQRRSDHVHIRFEARTQNSLRIAISRSPVQCEILRTNLQNLTVLFEPNARCEFDCVAQIVRLNIASSTEFIQTAAVNAVNAAADPNDGRLGRRLRAQFRFMERELNALRKRILIR